mmetsp:Transcript_63012/g.132990  ORF Transcript_63012/g.132990 Transcript_63012/m.132990 type:complete len:985 (+) Transcript_63012:169-3123(+)|eukprot:CAMPEP_0206490208 /NCGR_PEP_ID=MMETSP0324_2-20121206/43853_1 /ASSEMBLY_ACC=CAM_ASM_000836 /TAXON_ID=2866 /ORGANISM="Crypthecodinium cohnii, Strain Seligo" /LENGTH=984 /DNA_ID=CAMNT_0053970343 /DNA_START=116 /DNA_END=3070 /DNA_ORIENTATION=+
MAPKTLALGWYCDGETLLESPLVVSSFCAFTKKTVENAGNSFWDRFEKPLMKPSKSKRGEESVTESEIKIETERERAFREKREKKQRESKGKDGGLLKISDDLKGKDLYDLLEIEAGCSAEDLKKSYRKLVLVHHPDKMTDPTEAQKKHFLLIQEAYDIVSDPEKRRRYESTLDFDDNIPTNFGKGKLADADFFKTFKPVFKRNARWSVRSKVPDLGDENTPIEQVKKFYDFWYEFESWRDPLAMAEKEDIELYNLEEAECREEKRWMERENGRVAKKLAAAERDRIASLVKVADKNDPRMNQYREDQRLQKEAVKAEKYRAEREEKERKEAEERVKAEAAEAKRKEEEAKKMEERKKKEAIKNALKNARHRLRSLHREAKGVVRHNVHADQLQEVCLRCDTDYLNQISDSLEAELEKCKDPSFQSVVDLLHDEISKLGLTPITDASVDPNSKGGNSATSTASGESGDEGDPSELDASPGKTRELTPEEQEAERLRKEAEEAAERERQEKKAEEQRKKKEQQKKAEEAKAAALRKAEKKENEAKKAKEAKEAKKKEQEAKQAEEQRLKQQAQREAQRLQSQKEEEDRRRAHEEQLTSRAFEVDRAKRVTVLEAYEDGVFEAAFRSTLLQETAEPNSKLLLAIKQVAGLLPAPAKTKAESQDQARREAEELCLDAAVACLTEAGADITSDEPRARLAAAVALGIRPAPSAPALSNEGKAAVKKQRNRVRSTVLSILKSVQPAVSSASGASERTVASSEPKPEAITLGTEMKVVEETTLFESPTSYNDLGVVPEGEVVIAGGAPVEAEGYYMVPLKLGGAVELRVVRLFADAAAAAAQKALPTPPAAAGKASKGAGNKAAANNKATPAKSKEPELDGNLLTFLRLAKSGTLDDFQEANFCGFDAEAAIASASLSAAPAAATSADATALESEAVAAEAASQPVEVTASNKKKKGKAAAKPEEDLDALLEEFGVANQGGGGKKKKGKK